MKTLTVSEVARVAGITVRTLHHYDDIGLLRPGGRTKSGYRLYHPADLETLQEILFWRELGLSLEDIGGIVTDPGHDRTNALERQRTLLAGRALRLQAMIEATERALVAHREGTTMDERDMFEVFGDFDPADYEKEVEERWSGPALEESRHRTSQFSKDQWLEVKEEGEEVARSLAALLAAGVAADSAEAMDAAERHRVHIERFYSCSYEMHRGLGDLYVQDPRFTEYWDGFEAGLAAYAHDAIDANARRSTG